MENEEFKELLDLAEAEKAGRNIASVIRAFRSEMLLEKLSGMPVESIDELTVFFGKTFIARILLGSEVSADLEEIDESEH